MSSTQTFVCRIIGIRLRGICFGQLKNLIINMFWRHSTASYLYHALVSPYLNYSICAWGNCPQTYSNKLLVLQKRALCLICFAKPRHHAIPFFIELNCLPLQSFFFQQSSYFLYDVHAKTAPKVPSISLRKSAQNITIKRDYLPRSVSLFL